MESGRSSTVSRSNGRLFVSIYGGRRNEAQAAVFRGISFRVFVLKQPGERGSALEWTGPSGFRILTSAVMDCFGETTLEARV